MRNQRDEMVKKRIERIEIIDRLQRILNEHAEHSVDDLIPMTRKNAAKYLCICPETLTKHFNSGLVKGTRIGRKYLFTKRDLDRFINSNS